jgi:type I restriction enzyme S subunit
VNPASTPKGWTPESLGSRVSVLSGFAFDSALFSDITGEPLIRIRDLKVGKTETRYTGTYDPRYIVEDGNFLIGMDGEFACYRWRGGRGLLNQRVCKLVACDQVDLRFVAYGIGKHLKAIEDQTSYTTVKHLSARQIREIPFAFPPLTEQRRIADLLDRAFEEVSRATEAARAKIPAAAAVMRAIIDSEAIALAGRYGTKPLNRFAETPYAFRDGPFGSNLKTAHYSDTGARVIRLQNIGDGEFLDADKAFVPLEHFTRISSHSIEGGDILVAALGDDKSRAAGRACIMPQLSSPAVVKADCFRIRLPSNQIRAAFVVMCLNSPTVRAKLLAMSRGATRPRINLSMIRTVEIPDAPVEVQDKMITAVTALGDTVTGVRSSTFKQLAHLSALPQSLLSAAFRGEF